MTWVAGPESDRASPLAWSVPFLRLAGMKFRLHWLFLAFAAIVLLRSLFSPAAAEGGSNAPAGPAVAGVALVSLLVLVAAREVVRALVVRSSGGSADEITLWPLGALRGIEPASGWKCALATALAAPCASIVIFALLALPLGLTTGEWLGAAFPNPLDDSWLRNQHPQWIEILWIAQRTGLQLVLLHGLPMMPLDMGWVVSAAVLRARGPDETPRLVGTITVVVAAAVAIGALIRGLDTMVLAVAVACFVEGARTLRRIQLSDAVQSAAGWTPREAMPRSAEDLREEAEQQARERKREQAEAEAREVDRILAKIAGSGIDSLTRVERDALRRATERRRGSTGGPQQ